MQQICVWIDTCPVIMTYSCSYISNCRKHRCVTIISSLVDICSWFRQILYYIQVALQQSYSFILWNITSLHVHWHMNSCIAYIHECIKTCRKVIYIQQICLWIYTCPVIMTYSCSYLKRCNIHRCETTSRSNVDICSWFRQILYYIQVALYHITSSQISIEI